jgi:hypothetical protein
MKALLIAGLLGWASVVFAQAPDTLWTRHYGTDLNDKCSKVLSTADGGAIIIGSSSQWPDILAQALVLRVNSDGEVQWQRSFGGIGADVFTDAVSTEDGGYMLVGNTSTISNGFSDFWLLRVDHNGDSLWSRHYGGTDTEGCSAITRTSDFGYLLAGIILPSELECCAVLVIKVNSEGDSLWSYSYSDSLDWIAEDVLETPDGGVVIFGSHYRQIQDVVGPCFSLIKLNSEGLFEWSQDYCVSQSPGSLPFSMGAKMDKTDDGGYLLGGSYLYTSHGEIGLWNDAWVVKVDEEGEVEWETLCGQRYDDQFADVVATETGNYLGVGWREAQNHAPYDVYLVSLNSSGDTLWTKTIGGDSSETAECVVEASDGFIYVGGSTWAYGQGDSDIWLIKLDTTRVAADEYPHGKLPNDFRITAYPNPFNASTTISFDLDHPGMVRLKVFDITGREVSSLIEENMTAGAHAVTFDGTDLASGIYFYSLQCGEQKLTKKMVLIR